jgi:hypothetical protein
MDSKQEYKDAIEVSVIFHEGQRMLAVPKQPAPVQEQKPYAYANPDDLSADTAFRWCKINEFTMPVYTTPPAAEFVCSTGLCHYKAQRQWAGLTDEEFIDLCEEASNFGTGGLIRHIEAKLKEKNQ